MLNTHFGAMRWTLSLLICLRDENLVPSDVPVIGRAIFAATDLAVEVTLSPEKDDAPVGVEQLEHPVALVENVAFDRLTVQRFD
jgi:hypothetical protein